MEINTIEISGFVSALKALRLSYDKEPRSHCSFSLLTDGNYVSYHSEAFIDSNDMALLSALVRKGDDHSKVLRGVCVTAYIKAPIDWWCEMETYAVGHTRLMSESKMHTIYKGLTGEDLQKAREKTSITYPLKKIDTFNYQTLRRIYKQRSGHRLGEWETFLQWIESLPYAKEFILC